MNKGKSLISLLHISNAEEMRLKKSNLYPWVMDTGTYLGVKIPLHLSKLAKGTWKSSVSQSNVVLQPGTTLPLAGSSGFKLLKL